MPCLRYKSKSVSKIQRFSSIRTYVIIWSQVAQKENKIQHNIDFVMINLEVVQLKETNEGQQY